MIVGRKGAMWAHVVPVEAEKGALGRWADLSDESLRSKLGLYRSKSKMWYRIRRPVDGSSTF